MMAMKYGGINLAKKYKPASEWAKIDPGAGK